MLIVLSTILGSCSKKTENPNKDITIDAFSKMRMQRYSVRSYRIRGEIDSLCKYDKDSTVTDYRVRSYYLNRKPFLWIDRNGIDKRVDTLLVYLGKVDDMGFTEKSFSVKKIESDVDRIRNLNFDSINNINVVFARLEYRLTKAYLRYVTGQRFGFVNPSYLFNKMDVLEQDSNHVSYRKLYDVRMQHPGKKFFSLALKEIGSGNITTFLKQVQPTNHHYYELKEKLSKVMVPSERLKIMCNMERYRWRVKQVVPENGKYILVNIPAYKLYAVDGKNILSMRVGCGAPKTKTPLLSSHIFRMDVNPRWIVPMSIVKNDMSRHAGNRAYFDKRNMFITYKKTGEKVDVAKVTMSMLLSGDYHVVQDGGEGNSLGRIIFRFPNNFSVYLHDTSTKTVFDRYDRGVSHGCVRVEQPFNMAKFILGEKDQKLLDDIKSEMGLDDDLKKENLNGESTPKKRVKMRSINIKPQIPLFIAYYTLYKDENGNLESYPDVYGYDREITSAIKPFMK